MTVRKRTKRKVLKTPKWKRRRAHPIQIYLTGAELRMLHEIMRRRRLSVVSELVRVWIRRAGAAPATRAARAPREDPRQLRLV